MTPTKVLFAALACAAITPAWCPVARAQDEPAKRVTATGQADGTGAAAKDRAIADAMRKACEEAFGVYLASQSATENFVLIRDQIFTDVTGFVESYKVVSESVANGITTVTIDAMVSAARFRGRWEAIRELVYRKKRPRVMWLIYELAEDSSGPIAPGAEGFQTFNANALTGRIEEHYLKHKFFLVDRRQFFQVKQAELQVAQIESDLGRLVNLTRDQGAEVVIFGHVRTWPGKTERVMNTQFTATTHHVEIVAKAVRADSAKIIASLTRRYDGKSTSAETARPKAIESAALGYGDAMMEEILRAWNDETTNAGNVSLEVKNISFAQVAKLQDAMRQVKGVGQLSPRTYSGKVQVWDIECRMTAQELALALTELGGPMGLEVDSVQDNKIIASVKSGN